MCSNASAWREERSASEVSAAADQPWLAPLATRHSPPDTRPSTLGTSFFNMIEVVLALLVVSLGVIAIFGLVPYGARAHRDALHNNCSADAASDLLNYIATQLLKTSPANSWTTWTNFLPAAPVDISNAGNFPADINDPHWTAVPGTNIYANTSSNAVFRFCDSSVIPPVAGSGGTSRTVTDFDAIIRVWKSPSTAWQYNSVTHAFSDTTDATFDKRIILNAEVMWPAAPAANDPVNGYNQRRHACYALEVSH